MAKHILITINGFACFGKTITEEDSDEQIIQKAIDQVREAMIEELAEIRNEMSMTPNFTATRPVDEILNDFRKDSSTNPSCD